MKIIVRLASLVILSGMLSTTSYASDVDDLTAMLKSFLAGADTEAAHVAFWADDLVYTSSAGLRFGKPEIMAGFSDVDAEDSPPAMVYSATDIDIRVYGDTAIVAFKLVGQPTANSETNGAEYYFNTGTFLRRDGHWQVVAWQATRIPAE
ncbi:MAG TPA: nuclear transport factor 2 family protein [Woeseiaceae bacterium]|nr:nuclear transport factor 2 family protein [Woeseiaceae bacterium]